MDAGRSTEGPETGHRKERRGEEITEVGDARDVDEEGDDPGGQGK